MTRAEALEILGLDSDASLDDARKAYRALAKTYHPDKSLASNATVIFRIISDAWKIIQNTAEQEYTETEVMSRYTEAEEERKRSEEERQRAEAKTAQAEENRRHKEKKIEKKIKRFCYLGGFLLTFPNVLEILMNQKVLPFNIIIIYGIFTVCLGTLVYGWLTGWVVVKSRKKWFYKKGKEENIEVKILFRSCLVWFIIIFAFYWWGFSKSTISELIFGLQLDDPLAPQWYKSQIMKFLLFIVYINMTFIMPIFGSLVSSVWFGGITGSIIIKTSTWFKKKRLIN